MSGDLSRPREPYPMTLCNLRPPRRWCSSSLVQRFVGMLIDLAEACVRQSSPALVGHDGVTDSS